MSNSAIFGCKELGDWLMYDVSYLKLQVIGPSDLQLQVGTSDLNILVIGKSDL